MPRKKLHSFFTIDSSSIQGTLCIHGWIGIVHVVETTVAGGWQNDGILQILIFFADNMIDYPIETKCFHYSVNLVISSIPLSHYSLLCFCHTYVEYCTSGKYDVTVSLDKYMHRCILCVNQSALTIIINTYTQWQHHL